MILVSLCQCFKEAIYLQEIVVFLDQIDEVLPIHGALLANENFI